MESKICSMCNIEKNVKDFYKKKECKLCNRRRSLKCHYKIKDNLSNQQKIYYKNEKKTFRETK